MSKTYQALQEQSIFDVALMQYGSLEGGLAALLADNPDLVQAGGIVGMFGAIYQVRKPSSNNAQMRAAMQRIVPVTEGGVADLGAWINPNYAPWVTQQNYYWSTPSGMAGSGSTAGGVRPDQFAIETQPDDDNFEVYSQYGGVNRKAKLSTIGPRIVSVSFVPTASANTSHHNTVVTDPNSDVWFIAGNGDAIKLRRGGTTTEVREESWVSGTEVIVTQVIPTTDTVTRCKLFRNGIKLRQGADYTIDFSTNSIELVIPADNEVFEIFITI